MRNMTLLALALTFAACDSTGPGFTDPDDLRLQIVKGDGQVGSVQAGSAYIIAAAGPKGVLPDTLVARITDASGGYANVPPGTVVNYVVPEDGCGAPWIDDATPDDSAYVATLWERPASKLPNAQWHGDVMGSACTMEARTVVGGEFKTDTMFTAIFEAGPVHQYPFGLDVPGDTLLVSNALEIGFGFHGFKDRYDNTVPHWLDGDGWARAQEPSITARGGRFFAQPDSTVAVGDTATVRAVRRDGAVVMEALVTLRAHPADDPEGRWSVHLTRR